RSMLGGGKIQYWATTSDDAGMSIQDPAYGHHNTHPGNCTQIFTQSDRVGKPLVNELFATVANLRHQANDIDSPSDDPDQLRNDVLFFMTHAAGRSQATAAAAAALLTPSALVADLSQSGPAGYLGVETHGAIGSAFGGRALTDDVVDTTLGIAFGNTLASLGLVPDDGAEIPALTSDHVTQNTAPKHYQNVFPFLGPAQ
ncbi:MAG TPA: DUF4331 family protein, partial [Gemmataceae bacterium]|nr:DUF4331 family protein [Gemmataceae bacterium]